MRSFILRNPQKKRKNENTKIIKLEVPRTLRNGKLKLLPNLSPENDSPEVQK